MSTSKTRIDNAVRLGVGSEAGILELIRAMIERAVWDYGHSRSCFTSGGGLAVRTARWFLFTRGKGTLESIVRELGINVDVESVRERATNMRRLVEDRAEAVRKRKKLYSQWIRRGSLCIINKLPVN